MNHREGHVDMDNPETCGDYEALALRELNSAHTEPQNAAQLSVTLSSAQVYATLALAAATDDRPPGRG